VPLCGSAPKQGAATRACEELPMRSNITAARGVCVWGGSDLKRCENEHSEPTIYIQILAGALESWRLALHAHVMNHHSRKYTASAAVYSGGDVTRKCAGRGIMIAAQPITLNIHSEGHGCGAGKLGPGSIPTSSCIETPGRLIITAAPQGGGYKGDVVRRGTRNRHSGPTNYIQKVTDGALERCDY
jgi:hypothetical protein